MVLVKYWLFAWLLSNLNTEETSSYFTIFLGVIIVILVIILVIGLAVYWFKFRNNKKPVDVIAFTNSSYNNNESQITEKVI